MGGFLGAAVLATGVDDGAPTWNGAVATRRDALEALQAALAMAVHHALNVKTIAATLGDVVLGTDGIHARRYLIQVERVAPEGVIDDLRDLTRDGTQR
jgi:hypothetical protein